MFIIFIIYNINMEKINLSEYETIVDKVINPKGNILFLHGFTGNFNNKMSFRKHFSEYNFFAINMPNHGNSKYHSLQQLNTKFFVKVVSNFIEQNNLDNLIVLGHSMGGGMAIILENNFRNKIKLLILEAPANIAVNKNYDSIVSKLIPNSLQEMEFVANKLIYDYKTIFVNEKNYSNFINQEFNKLTTKYKDLKVMLDINAMNDFFNHIQQSLKNINTKTILILGDKDEIVPYEETKNNFIYNFNNKEQLEIITVENAAHLPLSENKNVVQQIKTILENNKL